MSKHTPGPWALSRDDREGMEWNIHVVQADAPQITVCFMTSDGPNEANARLIAAAPDLLAALRILAAIVENLPGTHGLAVDNARAAIARAALTTAETVQS